MREQRRIVGAVLTPPPSFHVTGGGDTESCRVNTLDPIKYINLLPASPGVGLIYGLFSGWSSVPGGHGGGIDSSSFNPPLARAVKPTHFPPQPTQDTPHSSLPALCLIYSWLTCSRGSTPPFWGTDISSYGLCNFKR